MKAIVFERLGGPEVLELHEVPDPVPAGAEVVVDVEAVGVNYRDVYERLEDDYGATPPAIMGIEGGGTTAAGERVAWAHGSRSYAERVAVDPDVTVPIPGGIPTDVAVAALLQGMTAHYLAFDSYPIEDGDWVLVHSAAGGVGLLLTQLAKLRGGRVIATTSSEEKAQLARAVGADEVIGYDGFAAAARELSGGGVAAVYDGVGLTTFREGLTALRPYGRMILYGGSSGEPAPIEWRVLSDGSVYVQRPTLRTYTRTPALLRERAAALFELIAAGRLNVRIGARYPLAEARRAHEELEARQTTGKLLLVP
ncbi:MAG: quinone oxidoreductase family protein [Gaiellaceae bacterium]